MKHVILTATAVTAMSAAAHAEIVQVRVTAENLAATNSVTFAPLRVGFHDGSFDVFNQGETATAPIISIAEGGSGSAWFPAFAAQQPNGTSGTVANGGPLLPGATATQDFFIDTTTNQFFTFAAMVVPSNDHFIGNDSGTAYQLFQNGQLAINSITQYASDIWDAGSEVNNPANAAFLVGSNNDDRIQDTGVVGFDFAGLSLFNGLETAAGYTFDSQLTADTAVYRISFQIVPAPGVVGAMGMAGLGLLGRRRRSVR